MEPADKFVNACYQRGITYSLKPSDLGEIAAYADQLGIHIIAEVDVPGHAASWVKAEPSLVAACP